MTDDRLRRLLGGMQFELPGDGSVLSANCRGYVLATPCDVCDANMDFILWFIVDGEKRPDLLQQITDNRLHDPICPRCGHVNHLESDLLLLRPSEEPVLLFSPAAARSPEDCTKVGRTLLLLLKQQLGAEWRDDWYEKGGKRGMFVIDRSLLPRAIREGMSFFESRGLDH